MKTFAKMIVAAIVAIGMACVAIAHDASDNLVIVTAICAAIIAAGAMGVFSERKSERSMRSGFKFHVSRFRKAA